MMASDFGVMTLENNDEIISHFGCDMRNSIPVRQGSAARSG